MCCIEFCAVLNVSNVVECLLMMLGKRLQNICICTDKNTTNRLLTVHMIQKLDNHSHDSNDNKRDVDDVLTFCLLDTILFVHVIRRPKDA